MYPWLYCQIFDDEMRSLIYQNIVSYIFGIFSNSLYILFTACLFADLI